MQRFIEKYPTLKSYYIFNGNYTSFNISKSSLSNFINECKKISAYDILWLCLNEPYEDNLPIFKLKSKILNISKLVEYPGFNSCNPSIVKYKDGYICNIRLVNYNQTYALNYNIINGQSAVITRNILCHLNSEFELISSVELHESELRKKYPSNVLGLEDIRLFWNEQDYLCGSATLCDSTPHRTRYIGKFQTTIHKDKQFPQDDLNIDVYKMRSPLNVECEKNWLPFNSKFLYNTHPFSFVSLDENYQVLPNKHYCFARGSAGPIAWNNGWLSLVHYHLWYKNNIPGRTYIHRFLEYDSDWNLIKATDWFIFEHLGIEFSLSMILHQTNLIIGYGYEDAQAKIVILAESELKELLKDVPIKIQVLDI